MQWIRITVCANKAIEAAATLKRGEKIRVEGRLSLDKWQGKDGADRYGLNVVVFKIEKALRPLGKSWGRPCARNDAIETHSYDRSCAEPFYDRTCLC